MPFFDEEVTKMAAHWQELLPIDRYIVAADGLLHEYDRKVLTFLYQPLIGPVCTCLYMTLWAELEENQFRSEISSHHLLMNLMGLNLKDIYEARLQLEGIGLLKTYLKKDDNERSFIYELHPPLTPEQFFMDGMLNVFLYRKIGKNHFARLKRFFSAPQTPNEEYYDVTRAFQEVFASATPGSIQYLQEAAKDLEADNTKRFIGRTQANTIQISTDTFDFDLLQAGLNESLVPKSALNQKSKEVISNLAFLYNVDAVQMKNLILGAMNEDDEIDIEELRKGARDWYQYINHDELPMLVERTQPALHRGQVTEPKTQEEKLIHYLETTSPLKVLKDLSGGSEPSKADLQIIDGVMFKQKLLPGVINVLIQYVMLKTDMKLSKGYVEKIASHWARKQIRTVKEAMELAKKEHRTYQEWSDTKKTGKKSGAKSTRGNTLPDWFEESSKEVFPTSTTSGLEKKD